MAGKNRKKGEWVSIANGRMHRDRDVVNGHGVSNIPGRGEVGSAAYRRSLVRRMVSASSRKPVA